jgi:hypothetical protein
MTGSVLSAEFRRTSLSRKNENTRSFLLQKYFLQTLYSEGSKFELIKHAHFQDCEKGRKSP